MRRFLKKFFGGSEVHSESKNTKEISHEDITDWMAGEADEVTRSAIAKELDDPNSPTSRHLAWMADPDKHQQRETNKSPPSTSPTKERQGPERFIGFGDSNEPTRGL